MQGQGDPWNRFQGTCCSYPEFETVSLTCLPGKQLTPSWRPYTCRDTDVLGAWGLGLLMAMCRPRVCRQPELGIPVGPGLWELCSSGGQIL